MSSDTVSEQFSISSSQGLLESASGKLDTSGQMVMTGVDPPVQHVLVSNSQSESMALLSSSPSMQQADILNAQTGVLGTMPITYGSQPINSQQSSLHNFQSTRAQLQQYSSVGATAALNSLGSTQLVGKRKSRLESVPNGSPCEKSEMPNKRPTQVLHRPWLQKISPANNGSVHMPPTSLSPRMQHTPTSSKKTMQSETAPSKSGKHLANKKQSVPAQSSSKTQIEGNEPVRSKMRESLASALALVQQRDESPRGLKGSQTEEGSTPGMTKWNSQNIEPDSAACTDTSLAEGTAATVPTSDESSVQKDAVQESYNETRAKDTDQSDGPKSQYDEVFPRDDVSFSESIFANDELLQGNGLSWVLEPVSDFEETKDNESGEARKSSRDPDLLASEIEMELFKLFGGVNKKYKEKGRSLLFNLKDKNNPELRERVMLGEIPPERLCSMTAEELASKELSQWRQAKAEKLAEMVVLRDADIDVRRLVRKTHKGEFQVEIDPVDSGAVDLSAEVSSHTRPQAESKAIGSSLHRKAAGKKDGRKEITKADREKITIPSNDGTDPMQGLSMDDEMKDVDFLPPIVSLDEFMESLDSEPPFGSPSEDAKKKEPGSATNCPEADSDSKSSQQSAEKPKDSLKLKPEKINVVSSEAETSPDPSGDISKSEETSSVTAVKGESVWDGLLQLNISSLVSVVGLFKSGEKTQTSEWPALVEVKGRVRLNAFGKFLQELPMSRSRALMVMCLVCKDGVSKSQRGILNEAGESYIADQRVGYAEPASGVELYLCPPRGETLDLLSKIVSKDQLEDFKCLEDGLVGVVVWRRPMVSPSAVAPHKPSFKRQHSSSSRNSALQENKDANVNVVNIAPHKPVVAPSSERAVSMMNHGDGDGDGDGDDDDDDVPPGFGPGAVRDDDDLPEFNFSSSGQVSSSRPQSHSRSVDQVRQLIHKYGKSAGLNNPGIQPWNRNHSGGDSGGGGDDDDDDDIPEWRPQAPYGYQTHVDTQARSRNLMVRPPPPQPRPQPRPQPQPTVVRRGGWWADQNRGSQHHGMNRDRARPRNRGF